MAAVIAAVLVWWLFSGNGPQGPPGNDPRLLVPDADASATPGAPVPAEPTAAPGTARIVAYVVERPDKVLLRWTTDAQGCGELGTPRVLETDVSVIVTLPLSADTCVDDAGTHTLRLALDSALDGRALLDGSTSPPVRVAPG